MPKLPRPKPSNAPTIEQAAARFDMDVRLYKLLCEVRKIGDEIAAEYDPYRAIRVLDPLIRFEGTLFDINIELKRIPKKEK